MDPQEPRQGRRPLRRVGHNYKWRATYFVTVVTKGRFAWFGDIVDSEVVLNAIGQTTLREWLNGPIVRPGVLLGEYVLMPNHLHAIVTIPGVPGQPPSARPQPALDRTGRPVVSRDLGALVRGFKGAATARARQIRQLDEPWTLWQRNYHEHIIRDAGDRERIERYIRANPSRWKFDPENLEARPDEFERSFWRSMDPD